VFAINVTVCRKCAGRMRILDVVRDPDDIDRIFQRDRLPHLPPAWTPVITLLSAAIVPVIRDPGPSPHALLDQGIA